MFHYLKRCDVSFFIIITHLNLKLTMKLNINIWNKYLLGFTFVLSYLNVISSRFSARSDFNWYIFTPEAPIASLVNAIIIFALLRFILSKNKDILYPEVNWKKLSYVIALGLVCYVIIANTVSLIIALIFGNFDKNFQPLGMVINNNLSYVIDYFLFSIIFMIYIFYRKNIQQEQHLKEVEQSLSESKIKNLKAQLNPHFLFNNLNSLDELIHRDANKASDFLAEFASIYRFSLDNINKPLIPLEDELTFATSYFEMMEEKYPNEYKLTQQTFDKDGFLVPPFSCQTLIENAIEHNKPEKDSTVIITIKQEDNYLVVHNNKARTSRKNTKSGTALENLKMQFQQLVTQEIVIEDNLNEFIIKIPLIAK